MSQEDAGRPVTVEELDLLVKQIGEKEAEIDAASAIVTQKNKELAALKINAAAYLRELGREKFDGPHGKIAIKQRWRINLPQTAEEKEALFAWMRERGIYDMYATVNANSLNSLYFAEKAAAEARGEDVVAFKVPGIGEEKLFEDISFKKGA